MFWRAVGRIIIVPLAFLIAAAVASFVLVTLGLERVTQSIHAQGQEPDLIDRMFDLVIEGHLLASGLTIIPAIVVVIVGEVAQIRSSVYYIIGGGLAMAAMPMLSHVGQSAGLAVPSATLWQVFATAGFAGGFIYWLIAGRRA